jgi:hypothetical protein
MYSCHFESPLKKHLLRLKVFFKVTFAQEQKAAHPATRYGDWLRQLRRGAPFQGPAGFSMPFFLLKSLARMRSM